MIMLGEVWRRWRLVALRWALGESLNAMISDVASLLTGTIVALKNSSMYLGTTLGSILYGLCIGSTRSVRLGS
jgi:hypothetical protein